VSLLIRAPVAWTRRGDVVENAVVLIEGGRIAHVGPASEAIEADEEMAGSWFLMPAGADRHVHVALSDPGAILAGGVTAVRDLGWPPEDVFPLADASDGPSFNGPRIVAAGPMLTAPGGYPSQAGWAPPGTALEVSDPEVARRAVEDLAARGAAAIKVALNAVAGPTLTDAVLLAVCDAAHGRGLPVTAHVQGRGQTERAMGAGIDELAHCPWEPLSDATVDSLARGVRIVSTLDIHSYGRDTRELRTAQDNLRRFVAGGGEVAYGTDLGNGAIPPGIHAREAAHLLAAGMSADQVLHAITANPLAPNAPADLIGLAGDPRENILALGAVRFVMKAGRIVRAEP
jgi:imidazolonepropionase-like amidohydrolase